MKAIYQPILDTYKQIINEFPDFIIEKLISKSEFNSDDQVLFAVGKNALILASKLIQKINFQKIVILQVQGYYDMKMHDKLPCNCEFFESTHPHISEINIDNSSKVIEILKQYRDQRLHIIISGGTSAAFVIPEDEVSFDVYREITIEAFEKGFDIENLNLIRSYLDKVKSGKLTRLLNSDIHTWIVSDVVSDDPAYIGSGPTATRSKIDENTLQWLKTRLADREISFEVLDNKMRNTEKMDNNTIIASRHDLIKQLIDRSKADNINIELVDSHITGDYTEIGDRMINKLSRSNNTILLFAGEPTVDTSYFSNNGKGGRISILLFYLSKRLSLFERALAIGIATDGQDGSSPHSAYVIDNNTFSKIRNYSEYITNGDTGYLLSSLNCGLKISTSNINLLDIYLLYLQNDTK